MLKETMLTCLNFRKSQKFIDSMASGFYNHDVCIMCVCVCVCVFVYVYVCVCVCAFCSGRVNGPVR